MSPSKQELESISVRRAKIADSDKVRYRVYTSHTEFIAVIAESALMAVKVSGVKVPHKIMRDLPTEGIAIEARKMAEIEAIPERVTFSLGSEPKQPLHLAEMLEPTDEKSMLPFVPMSVSDLRTRSGNRARILSPDMLNQIIQDHAKAQAPVPEPTHEPQPQTLEPEPVAADEHETVLIAEPELSPAERIALMASELPVTEAAPAAEAVEKDPNDGLSPEEVEKLLNG